MCPNETVRITELFEVESWDKMLFLCALCHTRSKILSFAKFRYLGLILTPCMFHRFVSANACLVAASRCLIFASYCSTVRLLT